MDPDTKSSRTFVNQALKHEAAVERAMSLPNQFQFNMSLPLRSIDKPTSGNLSKDFLSTIEVEYAARFLERIGATPSKANMDMVLSTLPISKCEVKAIYKTGNDAVYIAPKRSNANKGKTSMPKAIQNNDLYAMVMDENLFRTPVASRQTTRSRKVKIHRNKGQEIDEELKQEALAELKTKMGLDEDGVQVLQSEFAGSFPFHLLGYRLQPDDIDNLREEMRSPKLGALILELCNYIHVVLRGLEGLLNPTPEQLSSILLPIEEKYLRFKNLLKKRRQFVLMYHLPLSILSIRLTVELAFKNSFPKYFSYMHMKSPDENKIEEILTQILDPDRNHSDLRFLGFKMDALKAEENKQRDSSTNTRAVRQRLDKFFRPSKLVQSVLGEPSSLEARTMMNYSGKERRRKGSLGKKASRHNLLAPMDAISHHNKVNLALSNATGKIRAFDIEDLEPTSPTSRLRESNASGMRDIDGDAPEISMEVARMKKKKQQKEQLQSSRTLPPIQQQLQRILPSFLSDPPPPAMRP